MSEEGLKFHVLYFKNSHGKRKSFRTQKEMDAFIENFEMNANTGDWIDVAFEGKYLRDADSFKDETYTPHQAMLSFDLKDHDTAMDFRRACLANEMANSLWDIAMEVFRPARKYGYNDVELSKLIDLCPETEEGFCVGTEIISKLETKFYEIVTKRGVNVDGIL